MTGWYDSGIEGTNAGADYVYCIACGDNCAECDADGCDTCNSVADDAAPGFKKIDGVCSACPDNCNTCDTDNNCSVCVGAFFVDSDGDCSACPDNCLTCTAGVDDEN